MKKQLHSDWYETNNSYSEFLDNQNEEDFTKYVSFVSKYLLKSGSFLDIGCGTGIALNKLRVNGYSNNNLHGLEVSKTSLKICKQKKLNCKYYDGSKLPYAPRSFDIAGSINVLEHTDNPLRFLNEKYRVVKKGGYLLLACPNFLSFTNSYHHNTRGSLQKFKNLITLVHKSILRDPKFEKMDPIQNETFEPDDDAVNATNPLDILNWAKSKNLKVIYWSSQQKKASKAEFLDFSIFRLALGSCFFVLKKT